MMLQDTVIKADDRQPRRYCVVEVTIVVVLTIVTGCLRLVQLSHVSVEHFDEGVYASNYWFLLFQDLPHYPEQYLYAPPLLPGLIEWSFILFDPSRLATVWVNVLAGTLTVPLVWWMGRRWFGSASGVAAAVLAALSDMHLLYSRTALTDVLLCFWLLLAVFVTRKALDHTQSARWAIVAGLATGLAWWTKYSGWLPLAIGLSGLAGWMLFGTGADRHPTRRLFRWGLIAAVAFAVWSPFLYSLRDVGGYATVAQNHRQYLMGGSEWLSNLKLQAANMQQFEGWLTCGSLGLAIVVAGLVGPCFTWNRLPGSPQRYLIWITFAVSAVAAATLLGSAPLLAVAAIVGLALHITRPNTTAEEPRGVSRDTLGTWLLAAWFFGLLVSTPLYRAYPRLTLPWLIAAWIAAGAAMGSLVTWLSVPADSSGDQATRARLWKRQAPSMVAGIALVAAVGVLWWTGPEISAKGLVAWQSRTGLEYAAHQIYQDIEAAVNSKAGAGDVQDVVVYVYAEPAVVYHLSFDRWRSEQQSSTSGPRIHAVPVADLGFADSGSRFPVFLVVGPHGLRSDAFAAEWAPRADRFHEMGTYRFQPSDIVLLNEQPGRRIPLSDRPAAEIELWRLD